MTLTRYKILNRRTPLTEEFKKGDKVEWNTSQGKTTGEVKKKLTSPTDIKGHHVAASEDNPEYLIKSDKTAKEAAHKPDALKKVEESK
jgi:hypothetical protein